jgi:hypothetical protein
MRVSKSQNSAQNVYNTQMRILWLPLRLIQYISHVNKEQKQKRFSAL